MRKIERDYVLWCQSEGFTVEQVEHRGKHIALHFHVGVAIVAATPSGCRNRQNVVAQIRRLHRI